MTVVNDLVFLFRTGGGAVERIYGEPGRKLFKDM